MTFFTGLLAGAALTTLVPWDGIESGVRLVTFAALCGALVIFRLLFAGTGAQQAIGIVMIAVGGFLMSAGTGVLPGNWAMSPAGIGVVSFLFGAALLMRVRRAPIGRRDETVARLMEEQPAPSEGATTAVERIQALELLNETADR